jgi:hypothetical protein
MSRAIVRSFPTLRSGLRCTLRRASRISARESFGRVKLLGMAGPPLRHRAAMERVNSHGLRGVEEVSVGVVLVFVTPRVLPIIEDLTAEDVATDSPCMLPAACTQDPLANSNGIEVGHLIRAVAVQRHNPLNERERVMIRWHVAQIEAHEDDGGRAVRKHLHVARDETKMPSVPRAGCLKPGHFEHHVSQLHHLSGGRLRTLRRVDAWMLRGRVHGQRCPIRQGCHRHAAVHGFDDEAGWIHQASPLATAWLVHALGRGCPRNRRVQCFQISARTHFERKSHESRYWRSLHHVTEGLWSCVSKEQGVSAPFRNAKAEIGEESLRLVEVGPLESEVRRRGGFDGRLRMTSRLCGPEVSHAGILIWELDCV